MSQRHTQQLLVTKTFYCCTLCDGLYHSQPVLSSCIFGFLSLYVHAINPCQSWMYCFLYLNTTIQIKKIKTVIKGRSLQSLYRPIWLMWNNHNVQRMQTWYWSGAGICVMWRARGSSSRGGVQIGAKIQYNAIYKNGANPKWSRNLKWSALAKRHWCSEGHACPISLWNSVLTRAKQILLKIIIFFSHSLYYRT